MEKNYKTNEPTNEQKNGWRENWHERTLIILLFLIAGAYFVTHPPMVKHTCKFTSQVNSIDGVKLEIQWTATYKTKMFNTKYWKPSSISLKARQVEKVQLESSLEMFGWTRLSSITLQNQAIRLYYKGTDSLQLALLADEQIKQLPENVVFQIKSVTFDKGFLNYLDKRNAAVADTVVATQQLDSMKNILESLGFTDKGVNGNDSTYNPQRYKPLKKK